MDNEQLVVDGLIAYGVVEEVADTDQHLPFRTAEIEKRKRLTDLHVEASVDARSRRDIAARETVADAVEDHQPGRRLRHIRLERRRHVVNALVPGPDRGGRDHHQIREVSAWRP